MARIVAFAGPCLYPLSVSERAEVSIGIDVRPPARRGSVISAMSEAPEVIVLLDGCFFGQLAVAHKELLYALEAGVTVIGAASMGALRAVEMSPLGMIGVGTIYEWFASGELDGDDEVALWHLTEEHDYQPITTALVEVRHAAARLVEGGIVERDQGDALIGSLKRLSFQERTPRRVRSLAERHLGRAATALHRELAASSLKACDARRALEAARSAGPPRSPRPSSKSIFLTYWCEAHFGVPSSVPSLPAHASLLEAWSMVQLFHDEAPGFVAQLRLRFLAASAAGKAGLEAEPARLSHIAEGLSRAHDERWRGQILPRDELCEEAWVQALSDEACHAFGGAEAAADWLASYYGLDAQAGHRRLLHLLSIQFGLQSSWHLARSFAFAGCLDRALDLASAANEISECFELWSQGSRIATTDLIHLAAGIWSIDHERVREEASRRGLLEARGFSRGLWEILQRVAPAERLSRPLNDYAARKQALRLAILDYPLELFPSGETLRGPRIAARSRPTRFAIPGAAR